MPVTVLDIEQHLLLLELQAPFDKRDVQLARRRMAKRWHPDVAPPGKAVRARAPPEGDQRGGRPARAPGRGLAGRERLPQRRPRQRRRRPRASARKRAGARTRPSSARARRRRTAPSTIPSAAAFPTTRSCTATRAASPIRSGAWERSPASTSPRSGGDEASEVQQWARVKFSHGIRTVPAGEHALRRLLKARSRRGAHANAS